MKSSPHLNFRGDARAALDFYATAFGGTATVRTYADFGMPQDAPGADRVVFGQVEAGSGFRVLGYDIPGETAGPVAGGGATRREHGLTYTDQGCFVSVSAPSLAELEGPWAALSAGATIVEPLAASAWSAGFGMLTDRFGVTWTVSVDA